MIDSMVRFLNDLTRHQSGRSP